MEGAEPPSVSRPASNVIPLQTGPRLTLRRAIVSAVFRATILWAGETSIGLIPLLTHYIMHSYTKHTSGSPNSEPMVYGLPIAEMNILTVVMSGLALLSLFNFEDESRPRETTPFTYLAGIFSVLLLVSGSLLYAIASADIGTGNGNVTLVGLAMALLMAFLLGVEKAWLKALYHS